MRSQQVQMIKDAERTITEALQKLCDAIPLTAISLEVRCIRGQADMAPARVAVKIEGEVKL